MKKRTQGKGGQGKKKKHFQSHKGGRKGAADEAETEDAATKSQVGGHGKNEAPLQMIKEIFGLKTVFAREPDDVVAARKLRAHDAVTTLPKPQWMREELRPNRFFGMPVRPPWSPEMSKEELEKQEHEAFSAWMTSVYEGAKTSPHELNFFEHNLEVWRQLWRSIEMGDVLLICCDVRWPSFTFPVALFEHATRIGKPVVLTLTKTDLVPQNVSRFWEEYFSAQYPKLFVALTNAFAPPEEEFGNEHRVRAKKVQRRKALKRNPESKNAILDACRRAIGWKGPTDAKPFFTISAVGAPNAGKSAVINLLVEAHKVAVSATPGKTKHFQTHFINAECRLLDSPGLTFPSASAHGRVMQAIVGNYPVSQLREPFSALQFLLTRLDLPKIYGLKFPYNVDEDEKVTYDPHHVWSAYEVCEALANKRGFSVSGGGFDVYRAGKAILKEALDGFLKNLYWLPPKGDKEGEDNHEEAENNNNNNNNNNNEEEDENDDDEENGDEEDEDED